MIYKKNSLHSDYVPTKINGYIKSPIVRGMVVRLRFVRRLKTLTIFNIFQLYKDVYFWLPYKNVIEGSSKYSLVGPKKRDPYASIWFEVKRDCKVYKIGLSDFILKEIDHSKPAYYPTYPFPISMLSILTRKSVIKKLDEFALKNKFSLYKRK